jgi:uncharacterized protein
LKLVSFQGVTGAYLTRIAGKSFIEYFKANQNWGDGGISEFIKSFVTDTLHKLGKPL